MLLFPKVPKIGIYITIPKILDSRVSRTKSPLFPLLLIKSREIAHQVNGNFFFLLIDVEEVKFYPRLFGCLAGPVIKMT